MTFTKETQTHAMCRYYGHEWAKSDFLTAKASKNIRVEVCKLDGCDAGRRILER